MQLLLIMKNEPNWLLKIVRMPIVAAYSGLFAHLPYFFIHQSIKIFEFFRYWSLSAAICYIACNIFQQAMAYLFVCQQHVSLPLCFSLFLLDESDTRWLAKVMKIHLIICPMIRRGNFWCGSICDNKKVRWNKHDGNNLKWGEMLQWSYNSHLTNLWDLSVVWEGTLVKIIISRFWYYYRILIV